MLYIAFLPIETAHLNESVIIVSNLSLTGGNKNLLYYAIVTNNEQDLYPGGSIACTCLRWYASGIE